NVANPKMDEPKIVEPKNDVPKKPEPKSNLKKPDPGETQAKLVPEPRTEGYFPRRALLISVNNYLFANSLHYGSMQSDRPSYPGSSISVLARQLSLRPFWMPATQITELSDGGYGGAIG